MSMFSMSTLIDLGCIALVVFIGTTLLSAGVMAAAAYKTWKEF
jgi:hypothetical protein